MSVTTRRPRQRTNIEIDMAYVATIMERYQLRTKTEAVDLALATLAGAPMGRAELLALRGTGGIDVVPDAGPRGSQW
ncbi:MAG TPA: type II toxin-antitoxin system VapB family antitoxin [Phycicoccus sp.]|nr:type II toxin-antitoxin system VapB family antitoxin [Phycicoccus sp.]